VPVAIRVFTIGPDSRFPEDTRDLSFGGFSIDTAEPLPQGTQSKFSLALPHHNVPLEISGEVVWSRSDGQRPGMGVRFIPTPPEAHERLVSFVDKLIKDSERI
jgi:type IV pilus assembly protein PilZ